MNMVRVCASAVALVAAAAATAVAADVPGRLEAGGGMLAGDLVPAPEVPGSARDTFLWRSARFAAPFEFRIGEVSGIVFPGRPRAPAAPGPFVHLRGGDVLAGTIESLDAETLVLSLVGAAGPQRLHIDRREVAAITRSNSGAATYSGPSGLEGWEQSPPGSWREDVGRIIAVQPGATVTRDVSAPARARFEIRLSRRRAAEFRIAVAAAERPADDGYVMQAVGGDGEGAVMLVRRSGGRAAIEPAPENVWRDDSLRVVLFVDQTRGRLAAVFPDAGEDGEAPVIEAILRPAGAARPSGRFRLELSGGEICLEQVRVGPWLGDEPTLRDADATTVITRAGALDGFAVKAFDAAAGAYVLERAGETRQVPVAEVDEVRFPDVDEADGGPPLRAFCTDGVTLSGDLAKVDDTTVWLRRRGVAEPVSLPRTALTALRVVRSAPRRAEPGGRVGTLVAGSDRVRGWLADGGADGLAWWPVGSVNAAAFAGPVDAEVEYVARKPERKGAAAADVGGIGGLVNRDDAGFFAVAMLTDDGAAARDGRIQPGDRIVAIAPTAKSRFVETQDLDNETVTHLLRGRIGTIVRLKVTDATGGNPRQIDLPRGAISVGGRDLLEEALKVHARLAGVDDAEFDPRDEFPSLIILRSGDVARCRIEAMDGDSLTLRAPPPVGAAPVTVQANLVKAVELMPAAASRTIDRTLLDRLLTLPRMQRDRPPTHLLRLVDGDYLRGRLLKVDERTVTFEVLDVAKQLPRAQVARIIWLHPNPQRPDGDEPAEPEEEAGIVAQGVAADDRRMTLLADGVKGNVLRGRSRAFGESGIDLQQIDRLLLGAAVGRDAGELPYAKWQLKPAPEPRALTAPGGE